MSTPVPAPHWRLDHIGVAVKELAHAISWYEGTTGMRVTSRETVDSQQVEVAFIGETAPRIELLAPLSENGPLATFLTKRGPGLHHLCYAVSDLAGELARLQAGGARLIDLAPRPGAEGALVAFIHPSSCGGVLTELAQHPHT